MFSTNAISAVLGVNPDQIQYRSFYEYIQENCLSEAIRCLESAKSNDSIAYLRFWSRDPLRDSNFTQNSHQHVCGHALMYPKSEAHEIDEPMADFTENSSADYTSRLAGEGSRVRTMPSVELEAVVSCTSDGLVVILRRARPPIPTPHPPMLPLVYEQGLFAAPWAQQPIRPYCPPELLYTFQPPLMPQYMPIRENVRAAGGPPIDQLLSSIRDVGVFAWGLVGINRNLAHYSQGYPQGEAQPDMGVSSCGATETLTSGVGGNQSRWDAQPDMNRFNPHAMETETHRSSQPNAGAYDPCVPGAEVGETQVEGSSPYHSEASMECGPPDTATYDDVQHQNGTGRALRHESSGAVTPPDDSLADSRGPSEETPDLPRPFGQPVIGT